MERTVHESDTVTVTQASLTRHRRWCPTLHIGAPTTTRAKQQQLDVTTLKTTATVTTTTSVTTAN